MRYALIGIVLSLFVADVNARDVYVKPHITKDGSYVEGHHRTSPNDTKIDNYSSQGNYNPYTGAPGTRDPYAIDPYEPRARKR